MTFDPSKVTFEIEAIPEIIPVFGNAMASGDDAFDRECEERIIRELDNGNLWAWCTVIVTATYDGIDDVKGTDCLGCCSYDDEDGFKAGGYWEDMQSVALEDLRSKLQTIADIICE